MALSPKLFLSQLTAAGKHVCVGLDTDLALLPDILRDAPDPILAFNTAIIDATLGTAAAYKLNFAFYEKGGLAGMQTLLATIEYINNRAFIIGDAKRGDIGNTGRYYADAAFNAFKCHAVTVHPYMGTDSVMPFLNYHEHITYLLGLTSNAGADDFEKQTLSSGRRLYQEVIRKAGEWNINGNLGIVFGATNPAELASAADSLKGFPLLIPGVGAQGGNAAETAATLRNAGISNFLINSSRAILYAERNSKFAEAAAAAALSLHNTLAGTT